MVYYPRGRWRGKSEALRPIAELAVAGAIVEELTQQGYQVRGLAPTGSAAKITRYLSAFRRKPCRPITFARKEGDGRARNPDSPPTLYVIDEGSIAGARMMHKFAKSVRPQDRVIIAYDWRQHKSVEAGDIVKQLEDAGLDMPLEEIQRQRESPELLSVVNKWKDGSTCARVA